MYIQVVDLQSLVILSGASTSNVVTLVDDAKALGLWTPAALTGVVTIEVEPSSTGTDWAPLQSGGADVQPAALKHTTINPIAFRRIRMTSNAAEGADRTFKLVKSIEV